MELKQLHIDEKDIFLGFAESRIGGRQENQDSLGVRKTKLGTVVTVCDGMGGGPGGKTASTIAVDEILSTIKTSNGEDEPENLIIKAVRKANLSILEYAKLHPKLKGMGSTATVLVINENVAYVAHVGDSRVYQLRGKKKVFRTFDHSMVFDLVKQKVISEEQARLSAESNIITRALGIKPDVDIDVAILPYEKGDRFFLCTDGIHGTMPEPELIRMMARKMTLGGLVDDIATYVDQQGHNYGGGHDNLTLAVVQTKCKSKIKPKMSKKTKFVLLGLSLLCILAVGLNIYQYSVNAKSKAEIARLTLEVKHGEERSKQLSKDSVAIKKVTVNNSQKSNNK